MSELIHKNDNRVTIRWKLLTTVSAVALTAYVSSTGVARAEDGDRPTIWIDLGGQMEQMQGLSNSTPFTAPFMFITPTPEAYQGVSIKGTQRPPLFAFGGEGKISFQPQDSDWIFSAGIRYGRSHARHHVHQQTAGATAPYLTSYYHQPHLTSGGKIDVARGPAAFLDATTQSSEHHLLLDFSAGKDVGIGLLGRNGSSNLSVGVRFLDISENMSGTVYARPPTTFHYPGPKYTVPQQEFYAYTMTAHAARSFSGLGPSLSWSASTALAGNKQDGELRLDWSINAAALFGRQKAKTTQSTQAYHFYQSSYGAPEYPQIYNHDPAPNVRSRKVTIPNVGATVGLSVKYPNFKFSIGYRYDTFLKAMDTGLDVRKTSNLTFNGPYASISIGLGD